MHAHFLVHEGLSIERQRRGGKGEPCFRRYGLEAGFKHRQFRWRKVGGGSTLERLKAQHAVGVIREHPTCGCETVDCACTRIQQSQQFDLTREFQWYIRAIVVGKSLWDTLGGAAFPSSASVDRTLLLDSRSLPCVDVYMDASQKRFFVR